MRHHVAIALALGLAACGDSEPANPSLTIGAGGFTLSLPPAMQQALESEAPGFQQIRSAAFRSDISQSAAESGGGMQAMFAVIGDFDGDGTQDAAVEGSVTGDTALVVVAILNKGGKSVATRVTRFPTYDGDAVGIYLSKPKGAGAFTVVNYPDATVTYKFSGGKFSAQ